MAEDPIVRKTVGLPKSMWDAIADYRFSERISTEAGSVRRLVQAGLDAAPRKLARAKAKRKSDG